MKIIVTSDTHITENYKTRKLPERLLEACRLADLIIHAGDFQSMKVYEALNECAPLKGVHGNVDSGDIRAIFPDKQIIEVAKFKIGVVHGHGENKTTEKRAIEAFELIENLDIIIFGHSHIPYMRYVGKTLVINPGSPTDKRKMPYYSYAILEINDDIRCEFIYFN